MRYGDYLLERLDKNYAYRQPVSGHEREPARRLQASPSPMTARRPCASVSLSVQPGEIVALLGANRAAKSTTVRMIAGVLTPQKGDIRFAGEVLTARRATSWYAAALRWCPRAGLVFPRR